MLESALFYKGVFTHLAIIDKNYTFCPSFDEWKKVELLSKFMKLYYDVSKLFWGSKYPTSNLFFHGVWQIQHHLQKEAMNPDPFIREMLGRMQRKFDSYWQEYNLVLTAIVLDPRYKVRQLRLHTPKFTGQLRVLKKQSKLLIL